MSDGEETSPSLYVMAARLRLEELEAALDIMRNDPDPPTRVKAFHRFVRDAREITFALQKIRGIEPERFAAWYGPREREMKNDPLLQAIVKARNAVEKQGAIGPGTVQMGFSRIEGADISRYFLRPQLYPSDFFIADGLGRSGWRLHLPNGRFDYRYVKLPDHWGVQIDFHFRNPPETHLGRDISTLTLVEMCQLATDYYTDLVDDADDEFGFDESP